MIFENLDIKTVSPGDLHGREGRIVVGKDFTDNRLTTIISFIDGESGIVYVLSRHEEDHPIGPIMKSMGL